MGELTITKKHSTTGTKIEIAGYIATSTAGQFEQVLDEVLAKGEKNILLNMTGVTVLGSAGIRVILKTYKKCTEAGGKFQIEEPSQTVRNVLGLSALEPMLVK